MGWNEQAKQKVAVGPGSNVGRFESGIVWLRPRFVPDCHTLTLAVRNSE
jgi:hypothetical protein